MAAIIVSFALHDGSWNHLHHPADIEALAVHDLHRLLAMIYTPRPGQAGSKSMFTSRSDFTTSFLLSDLVNLCFFFFHSKVVPVI